MLSLYPASFPFAVLYRSRSFSALLLAALLINHSATHAASDVDRYNVVWDSPGTNCHGSMPLGNGDIGLNVWVEKNGDLQFYIGKTDAWDDNGRLLKVGKVRVHLEPNPFANARAYRQELSLQDATLKVTAGEGRQKTSVRVWVDANHPVVQVAIDSDRACEVTASFELWRTNQYEVQPQTSDVMLHVGMPNNRHAPTIIEPDLVLTNLSNRIGWVHHNIKSVGPQMMAEIQGLTGFKQADPLLHRTFGAVITSPTAERTDDTHFRSPKATTHQLAVYVLTRHPATPAAWLAASDETIRATESTSARNRREAHEAWWREFWDRSWIHAMDTPKSKKTDAAYVSQIYALQRFVTAGAGRGAYPIKFNGSIFTTPPASGTNDADFRKWGPGYWWQNTRLPYESSCTAGDFDLLQPLFKFYSGEMLDLCKYRTRLYTGHEGVFFPECITFWGAIFSTTYGWTPFEKRTDKLQEHRSHKWSWVGGLELCALMLDYYEHTLDQQFLQTAVVPTAHELLTFFDLQYTNNVNGKMVMFPSQALETWWDCTNAMPELAGLHAVSARLLALPAADVSANDRQFWQRLHDRLPPLPTHLVNGKTTLAPAASFATKRNLENPELYAVFPFRLIAVGRPHREWGVNALTHRRDQGPFGWRQDDIFMAYLGLTDEARRFVVTRARGKDVNERFPGFFGPNYDWTPDQDHGGVLMKAFQAMLLQTDGSTIYLLPAWPEDWNVEFKLHAPLKTVIEGVYRNGKFETLNVSPPSRKADIKIGAPRD